MKTGDAMFLRLEDAIRLENAIRLARHACRTCGNTKVTVEWRASVEEYIPVSHHWARTGPEDSCPVLSGGVAAQMEYDDLFEDLRPFLAPCGGPYGGYVVGYDAGARAQLAEVTA